MKPNTDCFVESVLARRPDRASARRQVAEMALGVAAAIRAGGLTVAQAAEDLFTLDNYLSLRRNRLGRDLLEIFDWGMQLEDVRTLVPGPGALEESLRAITGIAERVLAVPAPAVKQRRVRKSARLSSAIRAA